MAKSKNDKGCSTKSEKMIRKLLNDLTEAHGKIIKTRSEEKKFKLEFGAKALTLYEEEFSCDLEIDGKKVSPRQFIASEIGLDPKMVDEMVAAARAVSEGADPKDNWKDLVKKGRGKISQKDSKKDESDDLSDDTEDDENESEEDDIEKNQNEKSNKKETAAQSNSKRKTVKSKESKLEDSNVTEESVKEIVQYLTSCELELNYLCKKNPGKDQWAIFVKKFNEIYEIKSNFEREKGWSK